MGGGHLKHAGKNRQTLHPPWRSKYHQRNLTLVATSFPGERDKFRSLLGSVGKLSARQTLTFQPLPSITSVESAKIWKALDQPKPGSLFGKMRDPGNEVALVVAICPGAYIFVQDYT